MQYSDNEHLEKQFEKQVRVRSRTLSMLNMLFGAWLIVSPYILTYGNTAKVDQTIFGVVILLLASLRYAVPRLSWPSVVNSLSGIWLVISPFILNYQHTDSYWNQIIFGALVLVLALSNSLVGGQMRESQHHHLARHTT